MTSTKPPTPARLSSISTSLLTSILELSQQNSLELTVNPATKSKILKNLLTLRDGLIQTGVDEQDQILVGLRNQYQRIVGLVRGVGGMETEIQGIDLSLPSSKPPTTTTTTTTTRTEEPLIDVEGTELEPTSSPVTSNLHQTQNTQSNSQSSMAIDIPSTTRTRSRKAIEEDEELMRSENEQVQRIQQVLLDDQDRTLDELSNAISRQRDLSLHISSELEVQENLLDELDQDLDFTSNRLTRANKRMDNLFKKIAKDGACWTIFGLVAILLFLIVLLK
ncbi:hypothetical protein PGT21_030946 [Puccinia graminis f. sp. tritici]|uniref:t-SNARE coiled-coil homology domain-containing protein n=1 Tax=Puccinia graminis f. sp. tritici TaxID=56615 RepID=A0A5B0MG97_PUCGR|nr:hypothetical protein PGT21_030946 [Puccinia graminis f. sp. tritici]